ncbi:hypothetical protein PC128_g5609 [Phytophthora cactorum]|nr:hypothetical protein PC128_g5609 [Phytophthora cactorum]
MRGRRRKDDETAEVDGAGATADRPSRMWRELRKEEMNIFAQNNDNMAKMRADGWPFDADQFPPYGWYAGEFGPTYEVLRLADSPLKLLMFFMTSFPLAQKAPSPREGSLVLTCEIRQLWLRELRHEGDCDDYSDD